MDAAFRNRDGSTALVVHNENDDPRSFAVAQGGRSFDYTLPGGALATFTWPASRTLDDDLELLDADRDERRPPRPASNPATRSTTTPPRAGRPARPSSPVSGSRSTSADRRRSAGSSSTRASTPATTRAATRSTRATTASTWSDARRHRRRPGPADHHRHCGDRSTLPPRRPDRDRATVVVDRRPAGLPLRRRADALPYTHCPGDRPRGTGRVAGRSRRRRRPPGVQEPAPVGARARGRPALAHDARGEGRADDADRARAGVHRRDADHHLEAREHPVRAAGPLRPRTRPRPGPT